MSIPKAMLIGVLVLFSGIGIVAFSKKKSAAPHVQKASIQNTPAPLKETPLSSNKPAPESDLPNIDRISQLFAAGPTKLPIVETIEYSSSVPWLKGRPAWVADYAVYYGTSKHFIARSLNNAPDYFSQNVRAGSKFNVFRKDKNIEFHLVVDITHLKLAFYYLDRGTQERVLLKTYPLGLGRLDPSKPSGSLTPLGSYSLGIK